MKKLVIVFLVFSMLILSGCFPHTYERYAFKVSNKKTYNNLYDSYYYNETAQCIRFFIKVYDIGVTIVEDKTIYHAPYNIGVGIMKNSEIKNGCKVKEFKINSIRIAVNENKVIDFLGSVACLSTKC